MPVFFLSLNSLIYIGLAMFCTLRPVETAERLGLAFTGASGQAEFLVVYGGLELALGLFFGWCAWREDRRRSGCVLGVLFYASISLYRASTLVLMDDLDSVTTTFLAFEVVLLIVAVIAWRSSAPRPAALAGR